MRLGRRGNAYPRNQPSKGGISGVARRGFWEECVDTWGPRVSPGGGCAERRVQHGWPGHQGLVEYVDDRPGPAKKTDISASCLAFARPGPGLRLAWSWCQRRTEWGPTQTRLEVVVSTIALAYRSSTMRSDRLPTSRSG